MSLVINFKPKGGIAAYDEAWKKLEAAGAAAPAGRLYHVSYGSDDDFRVTDVWESQEAFDAFGQTLMPILQEVGLDPGQPEVLPVHSIH